MRRRRHLVLVDVAGVPGPDQPPGMEVEAADHPGRLLGRIVVDHRAGDHHHLVRHHRRRGRLVEAGRPLAHADLEVERPVIGEPLAQRPAIGVELDHAAVIDRQQDAVRALGRDRLPFGVHGARLGLGIGDAAAGQMLEGRVVLDLRVERPAQRARLGVDREHALMLRAEVERVAHLDRRHLEGGFDRIVGAGQIAGAERPGDLQLGRVAGRDLRQRRVAVAELGAPVRAPVLVRHVGLVLRRRSRVRRAIDRAGHVARRDAQPNREHDRAERRSRPNGERGAGRTGEPAARPGQQQPKPERVDDVTTRRERPEVEPAFRHRPDHRRDHDQGVEPQRFRTPGQQQHAGAEDADPRQHVKRRAAQRREPSAAPGQRQAGKRVNGAGQHPHDLRWAGLGRNGPIGHDDAPAAGPALDANGAYGGHASLILPATGNINASRHHFSST